MKKFSVNWENKNNENEFRIVNALSEIHAVACVEREISAQPLRGTTTMLSDGFITMFEVKEIPS
jgi:hypothetical protein